MAKATAPQYHNTKSFSAGSVGRRHVLGWVTPFHDQTGRAKQPLRPDQMGEAECVQHAELGDRSESCSGSTKPVGCDLI